MMKITKIVLIIILALASQSLAQKQVEAGVDEKIGSYLPMELQFTTSEGKVLKLKEIITKPTLLALVYFECPGICVPLQTELAWTVDKLQLEPGPDFQVISLSFDHYETPAVAAKWKANYLKTIKRNISSDSWQFLTGDSITIKHFTDAVGFRFVPSENEFVHGGTVITISPDGKISRYLFGKDYNPFDVKMALLEAKAGKSNPTISKVLQFCFSYDPKGRQYTLNITRIIGSIMLLGVGAFFGVLILRKRKSIKKEGV
ncbi:MAG: SCO1/SenC family protein [Ignavibacteria bacterium]|nr:MAG: SCO1/SenC family protein [Ignavibacteria bacterium]KAF0159703.1 MAG: SCO1/SenC family protein [Ignavibacteria bacterium]